jgi:hypothetical protein
MMRLIRFVATASALGAVIALVWWLAYYVIGGASPDFRSYLFSVPGLDTLLLLLWPTSILLLGDPTDSNLGLLLVAATGNVLLYGILGLLLWLGIYRSRAVLFAPILLIAGIWALLLSL